MTAKTDLRKTFVQVSGGRTSAYMAYILKDKPNHYFMFQNTGRERQETYDFLNKIDQEWKLNLIWLEYSCPHPKGKADFKVLSYNAINRDSKPFEELIAKNKAIPNRAKRFCTIELKIKTARRYIRSLGIKKWNYALGFRADENRSSKSDTMQNVITPLKNLNINARDIKEFWQKQPFDLDLPMLPSGKTVGGNCIGCFFHSEYQHANLCKREPEKINWLIEQEEKYKHTFNDKYSFRELMEFTKKAPDLFFDDTEFFCNQINGSCN